MDAGWFLSTLIDTRVNINKMQAHFPEPFFMWALWLRCWISTSPPHPRCQDISAVPCILGKVTKFAPYSVFDMQERAQRHNNSKADGWIQIFIRRLQRTTGHRGVACAKLLHHLHTYTSIRLLHMGFISLLAFMVQNIIFSEQLLQGKEGGGVGILGCVFKWFDHVVM